MLGVHLRQRNWFFRSEKRDRTIAMEVPFLQSEGRNWIFCWLGTRNAHSDT
jgi:hypothetical protein